MKTDNNIKRILVIILSIFLVNGLFALMSCLIPDQLRSILPSDPAVRSFVIESIPALITIGFLFFFKKADVLKISAKGLKAGIICGLPLIIAYTLLTVIKLKDLSGQPLIPATGIALIILRCVMVGIAEEGLFRGLIMEIFSDMFGRNTRKAVMLSIICSALVFGLSHFQNLLANVTLPVVIMQAVSAVAMGLVFGAITLRSGRSIIPAVIVHALIDVAGFISGGMFQGASDADAVNALNPQGLLTLSLALLGLFIFLMRRSKTDAVIKEGSI